MACSVRSVRHQAIYDVIRTLMAEDSSITTVEDITNWFKTNYPEIQRSEIVDAMVLPDQKNVDESKKVINERISTARQEAKWVNKLENMLQGLVEKHTSIPRTESPALKQIKQAVKKVQDLAKKNELNPTDLETAVEMIQALPTSGEITPDMVEAAVDALRALKPAKATTVKPASDAVQKRIERLAGKIDELLAGKKQPPKKRPIRPKPAEVKAFEDALLELERLADNRRFNSGEDEAFNDVTYGDIVGKILALKDQYQEFFSHEDTVSEGSIKAAVENIRSIRETMKIDRLDKSIREKKEAIERLSDPNTVDITDLVTDNTNQLWEPKSKELLEKQLELAEARDIYKHDLERARIRIIAKAGINIGGIHITGKAAEAIVIAKHYGIKEAWEFWRTLKFMGDISAFGVQLSPMVFMDLFISPFNQAYRQFILQDANAQWNRSFKRVGRAFNDGFFKVLLSNVAGTETVLKEAYDRYKTNGDTTAIATLKAVYKALRHTEGKFTKENHIQMLAHPLYDRMVRYGLKLSFAKSISGSEEFFRSNLINKIPILGWIKDMSEETMVVTLNTYRIALFEQFYKANPGLSEEEYGRLAETVNMMTGTTKDYGQFLGPASIALSAPRLMVAKMKLALKIPGLPAFAFVNADIPGTMKQLAKGQIHKGLKFQRPSDAHRFNMIAGIPATFGALMLLMSLINNLFDDDDDKFKFVTNPFDKDFMRVKRSNKVYDMTGGFGAIYRTFAAMMYLTFDFSEYMSYSQAEKVNYRKNVKGEKGRDQALTYIGQRLHPTWGTIWSVATGADFFGQPYGDWWGPEHAHMEAAVRGLLPIFFESTMDQYADVETMKDFMDKSEVNFAQLMGINAYEQQNETDNEVVVDYFNDIKYTPDIRYPDKLSKKLDSPESKYLKLKYKELFNQALGDLILRNGANPNILTEDVLKNPKGEWNKIKDTLEKQFEQEYADEISRLSDDPGKVEEKKKHTSTSRIKKRVR